jgi:plasmid replication initiation protein
MSANLDKLKELRMRLIVEQNSLIDALAATSATESLSGELIQKLAEVSAAEASVSHAIAAQEPTEGWG